MGNKSSTGSDCEGELETTAVAPAAAEVVVDDENATPTRATWVRDMNSKLTNFVDSFKNYRKIRNGFTRISNNDDEKRII